MATKAEIVFSATDKTKAAVASFKRGLGEIESSASRLAGVQLGAGLVGALTGAGIGLLVRRTLDGLDALNDLKDATGASIENLSALEDVAARTGTSFESMSSTLVKFNKVLSDADAGSAAANMLKQLGLNAEELKKIDPAEALRQTAVALSRFADDGDKARIIQALFGKSVKESAAFLKDLSEQGQLNATVTTEQAQAAEDFNKQLFQAQKNATDLGRAIVSELLPGLNAFAERLKGIKAAGGVSAFFGSIGNEVKANLNSEEIAGVVREMETLKKRLDFGATGAEKTGIERQMTALRAEFMRLQTEAGKTRDALVGFSDAANPPPADYSNEGRTSPRPGVGGAAGADKKDKAPKKPKEEKYYVDTSAIDELIERNRELNRVIESTPTAKLEKQRQLQIDLAAAYERGELGIVGSKEAMDAYLEAVKTALPEAVNTALPELERLADESSEFFKEAARNIQDAMGDTLVDSLSGDFDEILKRWERLLVRMASEAAAAELNKQLFGSEYSKTGQLGGLIGSVFSPGADAYPTVGGGAGDSAGYVTPTMGAQSSGGGGRLSAGQPVVYNVTNNVSSGGMSRAEVYDALNKAMAIQEARTKQNVRSGAYA